MLWDIIRDFIVQHITGGTDSNEEFYYNVVGGGGEHDSLTAITNPNLVYQIGVDGDLQPQFITLSDWLATTITAVIMVLLVVFAVWLVRWIFKAVSSAFLLK